MGWNDPGSKSAIKKGCTCPVMDNHNGKGVPTVAGDPLFWVSGDCPLHGTNHIQEDEDEELD